jgi:DNA polymerase-3 subunit delta'
MAFLVAEAIEHLVRAHELGRLAHAFLVTGPEGSGKRTLVNRLFSALNRVADPNRDPDLHLIEPESKSRRILVEQIRELEGGLRMRSIAGKLKFGVVIEADRMMPHAANAFLKTLEEPPSGSLLLLLTSLPDALLETIRSRCVVLSLRPAQARALAPAERDFLDRISEFEQFWTVGSALTLARFFQDQLIRIRQDVEADHDEKLKQESDVYKAATDGKWLAREAERLDVLTESRYIAARTALVERLLEWFGDALRSRQGVTEMDLNDYREATARFGRQISVDELLDRLKALQELRENLFRNVQEGLAIEVAFLKAFGPVQENADCGTRIAE